MDSDSDSDWDSDGKYVKYTFDWKLRWADFDQIGKESPDLRHYYVTSLNNVSYRWYAALYEDSSKIRFKICYDDGPLDKIRGVEYYVGVAKSVPPEVSGGGPSHTSYGMGVRDYLRGISDPGLWLEDANSTAVRAKYEYNESDRLTYQITIKIPTEMFAYSIPSPPAAPRSLQSIELFTSINNNEGDSPQFDLKIAGRDEIVFNCHKAVVASQSKALETIFEQPPVQEQSGEASLDKEQSVANPKKRKASDKHSAAVSERSDGVYKFPNLCAASLKSILEYLYTGNVTTSTLTVTELIEMGDAGEQFDLQPLKMFSAAELWKRVIIEEPVLAFGIARFADQRDELKYLKHRAMEVIAENYDLLGVKPKELTERFGGTHGEALGEELVEFMGRRRHPKNMYF